MALPWVRLDTAMFDHPKLLGLFAGGKHRAALVHVAGMAYAGKHETAGFIPREALMYIQGRAADAKDLVAADLWSESAGGWDINGWDEYQLMSDEAVARREKAKKAAAVRWSKANAKRNGGAS